MFYFSERIIQKFKRRSKQHTWTHLKKDAQRLGDFDLYQSHCLCHASLDSIQSVRVTRARYLKLRAAFIIHLNTISPEKAQKTMFLNTIDFIHQ